MRLPAHKVPKLHETPYDEHYDDRRRYDEHYDEHYDLDFDFDDFHNLDFDEHDLDFDAYVHTEWRQLHRRHSVLQQYLQYILRQHYRHLPYLPPEWRLLRRRRTVL